MDREAALRIVDDLVKTDNIRKHLIANEAIMRALGRKFEPAKAEEYALAGLLHDADYEATEKDLAMHTDLVAKRMRSAGAGEEVVNAVMGHCDKAARDTMMAKCLYAGDNMAGLITAAALVRPDRKLEGLTPKSVLKRFKEPAFARGANRDEILTCESELRMPLPEFTEVCLEAMKSVADELGL